MKKKFCDISLNMKKKCVNILTQIADLKGKQKTMTHTCRHCIQLTFFQLVSQSVIHSPSRLPVLYIYIKH